MKFLPMERPLLIAKAPSLQSLDRNHHVMASLRKCLPSKKNCCREIPTVGSIVTNILLIRLLINRHMKGNAIAIHMAYEEGINIVLVALILLQRPRRWRQREGNEV